MKTDTYDDVPGLDKASVVVRRVALVVICVVLFAIFGIAAPCKIYKYYESRQAAGTATVFHEEL